MTELDAARRYLQARGSRADLVAGGLQGLVERWERVVAEVARGYQLTLDDYLNDMDLRDLLAGALAAAAGAGAEAVAGRVDAADARFRALTVPTRTLWGDGESADRRLDPNVSWWYFRRPLAPGPTLASDLLEAGQR